jgi:lipoprotein NlpI
MNISETLTNQLAQWDAAIAHQPKQARYYVQRGMVKFKLAEIADSIADFDRAAQLDPTLRPYLWQRGLACYYGDYFAEGAAQFAADLAVNPYDAEESLWQYLCRSRLEGRQTAQETLLLARKRLAKDPRPIMQPIYNLYLNDAQPKQVLAMAQGDRPKFYAHLYIGLYYESGQGAEQDLDLAKLHLTKAASNYQLEDYMWYLARVHQKLRRW